MASHIRPTTSASENEISIPFQRGLSLGQPFDVNKQSFIHDGACKPLICPDDVKPNIDRVNRTTAQFSIVESLTDVCEILQLPVEYVLKVKANWILDDVVAACLRGADNPNTICITFRIQYLEHKQYLPESVKLNLEALHLTRVGNRTKAASDADSLPATLCVRAIEFGNELVVICRISISDEEELSSLSEEMIDELGNCKGLLGNQEIRSLDTFAKTLDKKLRKALYREVMKLEIEYCTYSNLHQCPATLTDMMEVIKEFLRQCEAWTDLYKHRGPRHYDDSPMMRESGTHKGRQEEVTLDNTKGEDRLHHTRAIIQYIKSEGNTMGTFRRNKYSESCSSKLQRLYELDMSNANAIETLQEFLASDFFISADNRRKGERMLEELHHNKKNIAETIKMLDFLRTPTDEEMKSLSESISTTSVAEYIKNVERLPPGPDLDLILIGKTGHGKSSTGNSILLRKGKFKTSGRPTSETEKSECGWGKVDERVIKVVDTRGVCDTKFECDEQSIVQGTQSFREAIALCPKGFHALVIVLRYGMRLTKEEKSAIEILKMIFGKDIIKNNCICVLTHGDHFESENGQKTFNEWCKSESGDLKDIFEECQYRCVLFDNQTENSKVRQRQIVELVYHVDKLNTNDRRFTNELFEQASIERNKIIREQSAPEMKEDVMRECQLIANEVDDILTGKYDHESHEDRIKRLRNLKRTVVDKLKTELAGSRKMAVKMNTLSGYIDKALHALETNKQMSDVFFFLRLGHAILMLFVNPAAGFASIVAVIVPAVVNMVKSLWSRLCQLFS